MIWNSLIIIGTVLASGALVFLVKSDSSKFLRFLLAFSGAFLMGMVFLTLVPEVYEAHDHWIGLFVLAGFLLQLLLELLTEGAEHGHRHQHTDGEKVSPFLLLIGICIHSFLEGMPIVGSVGADVQQTLVMGIVVHNIPIALTLMSLFLHYGLTRVKALVYLAVFAVMTPLGSLFGQFLEANVTASLETTFNYVLAVVIGIFLHVATSILFETEENHRYNLQKFITVLVGLATAFAFSGH